MGALPSNIRLQKLYWISIISNAFICKFFLREGDYPTWDALFLITKFRSQSWILVCTLTVLLTCTLILAQSFRKFYIEKFKSKLLWSSFYICFRSSGLNFDKDGVHILGQGFVFLRNNYFLEGNNTIFINSWLIRYYLNKWNVNFRRPKFSQDL